MQEDDEAVEVEVSGWGSSWERGHGGKPGGGLVLIHLFTIGLDSRKWMRGPQESCCQILGLRGGGGLANCYAAERSGAGRFILEQCANGLVRSIG